MFQSLWQKYGKSMLFPSVLIICGLLYFLLSNDSSTTPQVELIDSFQMSEQKEQQNSETELAEPIEQAPIKVMVDVKGAVKHPGVYEVDTASRVIDAVTLAGGYLENADTRLINHAQKLQDEMVIYIPLEGEEPLDVADSLTTMPNGSSDSGSSNGKINLNTADETALMTLPGIGPAKAQAILAYRQEIGSFKVIEDLKSVSGIGDKTFERLQELITVK